MPDPIFIDLRTALTDEAVKRALPHRGKCLYASPCIIGACMPKGTRRARFDNMKGEMDKLSADYIPKGPQVGHLIALGVVEFATERQADIAGTLQEMFDDTEISNDQFLEEVTKIRQELTNVE